jgi:putative ABC transport system permease protein
MLSYVVRDLLRNPRRTLASVLGVALAVGLVSGIALFVDASSSQMTARAVAGVTIDMQAALTSPLMSPLTVSETATPATALTAGQDASISLVVTNTAPTPATDVVVKDTLSGQLGYVTGSLQAGGLPATPSADGAFPLTAGVNLGALQPGQSITVTYGIRAKSALPTVGAVANQATVQSTEYPVASTSNTLVPPDLTTLAAQIGALPNVEAVAQFAKVDLPAGSVLLGSTPVNAPVTVMAFDRTYLDAFPLVSVTSGDLRPGLAVLSQPAVDLTGSNGATNVAITLPGSKSPLVMPVGGTADFTQASQLFVSRNPDTQGDYAGSPYVVVVDPTTFRNSVLPAYRNDATASQKNPPVIEFQIAIRRAALSSDPGTASVATQGIRRSIERVAPGSVTVTDNLSDALLAAKKDSVLAKTLFIFLGLPGVLLAAYLSRYGGGLLAESQRRERATLRARGIRPALLVRALAYNSLAVALLGSVLGIGLGIATISVLFGGLHSLPDSTAAYAVAFGLAGLAALVTTVLALYVPGRRALLQEVADERREAGSQVTPVWLRARLDLVMLGLAALVGAVTYFAGGYTPTPAAEAQSVSLSFYVLLAPVLFWIGATLLATRGLLAVARRVAARSTEANFNPGLVRQVFARSLLRRPQAAASGVIALALAIGFGVSLMGFITTYQAEKLRDARYVTGADVRVTVSVAQVGSTSLVDALTVPGVHGVTPLAQSSSVVVGTEKRTLVGIDPSTFSRSAVLPSSFFVDTSAQKALADLAADPTATLIDKEVAKAFNIQTGDQVNVQIPNAQTGRLTPVTLHAVGIFTNFPGFPQGVDFVTNLATYQSASGTTAPDMYLVSTDGSTGTNQTVATAIQTGPGRTSPMLVETTAKAVNKDQSTLAALNLDRLGRLEVTFTVMMSALGIGIFVFGLLLQRRKEHVTLRALGMRMRELVALVLGEAGLVAVLALLIGTAVGLPMAVMSMQILKPVFTIPPDQLTIPIQGLVVLSALITGTTVVATLAAGFSIRRTHLVEILREE